MKMSSAPDHGSFHHFGPDFRDNQRCVSLPDRDVEIVPEYSEHAPNIVGGVVKVK